MARRKQYVPTLKPVTGENKKKFEALIKAGRQQETKQDKYTQLSISKVYSSDEDMRL